MERLIEKIIEILKKRHWTIGIMESCTGGAIADSLTNIPGVSKVFNSGKVTYDEKSKIEAGVDSKVLDRYGVFSMEVAKEMSEKIDGEIGVGVTGNLPGEVFLAIRIKNKFLTEKLILKEKIKNKIADRKRMKREVVARIWEIVKEIV